MVFPPPPPDVTDDLLPERRTVAADRRSTLRYGENPHQTAALYADDRAAANGRRTLADAERRDSGKTGMSYTNYADADAALAVVREFDRPAAVTIKHAMPAGVATADSLADAYDRALATDPMSAFGAVVGLNRVCGVATAERVVDSFKEVVVAPGFTDAALSVLRSADSLRLLAVGESADEAVGVGDPSPATERAVDGGRLVQEADRDDIGADDLTTVTERAPTAGQVETMLFAWRAVRPARSNAVVLAAGTETVAIGQGQVSRVDAVEIAVRKAREHADGKGPEGAVLASDGFFPFADGLEAAAEAGVEAVVQPGGSTNDDEVTAAADEYGVAIVHTGRRCFRHG